MTDGVPQGARPQHDQSSAIAGAFALWWGRFVRHAEHRLGSPTEAEDAVSSAFAHAYEHRQRYDHERASLGTWLAAIVRNEVTSRLRKRAQEHATGEVAADIADNGQDVEALTLMRERDERLARAIARLSEREQVIIDLRFAKGLTNREIARVLDANERTIGVWLLRALRRLKVFLEEDDDGQH